MGVFAAVLTGIAAYARLIAAHPEAIGKWVSTASIAMTHAQTLQAFASNDCEYLYIHSHSHLTSTLRNPESRYEDLDTSILRTYLRMVI